MQQGHLHRVTASSLLMCCTHTTKAPKETHIQTNVKSTRELDWSSWSLRVRDERANGIWSDMNLQWQRQYLIQHQTWQKKVKLSVIFNVWGTWEEGTDANWCKSSASSHRWRICDLEREDLRCHLLCYWIKFLVKFRENRNTAYPKDFEL